MKFTKSLIKGKLIKRYKRFFVDVKLNKETVTAHCPNTGSMKTLLSEGAEAWCRFTDDPKRKLAWSLVLLGVPGGQLKDGADRVRRATAVAAATGIATATAVQFPLRLAFASTAHKVQGMTIKKPNMTNKHLCILL